MNEDLNDGWSEELDSSSDYYELLSQTNIHTSRGLEGVRRYYFYSIGELDSGILSLQESISSTFARKFYAGARFDAIFWKHCLANGVHILKNFDLI
jgi:hypothetical protein